MSEIRVENIIGETGVDAVKFTKGINVTGVTTATSFSGSGANLTSLPAGNLTGALPAISGANLTGVAAISNAQQFRLAADQAGSGSGGTVLTNWEECDTDYQAIGSNWSQSSGVFSTSATGIYLCFWSLVVSATNTGDAYDPNIQISTNSGGSGTWNTRSRAWAQVSNGTINRAHLQNQFLFDVSNTGTFRLRFRQSQNNDLASGTTIGGSSTETMTNIMFIRIGNT